ncbi:MAG: hypothetical protein QOF06_1459 [Solirubrobacterales bacterium]|nr:hypothetical protein [Solirubrobacterales bacterium]
MRAIGGMALGLVVVAALLIGCGGGDETATTASLTEAQFVKQANAVCERLRKKRRDVIAAYDERAIENGENPNGRAGLEEKLVTLLIPLMRERLNGLEALEAPEADAEKWKRMLDHYASGIETLEEQGFDGLTNAPQLEQYAEEARRLHLGRCMA